ncbi:alpha/beta hydrolase family protein [Hymenobacter coccineus]|uniref:alpha/beta hydrolase family protein n=1 Tax=Hymenobacter coccineus TaxID=1908235 RepID=UPI000F791E4A|nr:hypothetical protein [Hymenobacter coccineus]
MGHSDGGHGVLYAEAYAAEAPELAFVGAVAFAPFTSVAAIVAFNGEQATRDPAQAMDYVVQQNFNVGLLAAGLRVRDSAFDLSTIMGTDLQRLMPSFTTKGSVKIVADLTQAIQAKTLAAFSGFKPEWATVPAMQAFLAANDPAVLPGFTLRQPTLVLQGTADASVPEPLTAAFTAPLLAAEAPVIYHPYAGADHFTILPQALPEALAFMAEHLG